MRFYLIFFLSVFLTGHVTFGFDGVFWGEIKKFPVPNFRWGVPSENSPRTKARQIFYEGEIYKGKPTEVFAYYCTPGILKADATLDRNLPAVVCVHGGGGCAFSQWVELWASRGYAAIAIDWSGNGPDSREKNVSGGGASKKRNVNLREHLPNGGPEKINDNVNLVDGKLERDAWPYQAVGAIVRAHSLIRSFSEVDSDRTAITGISWGGYLTCLVSGIDSRFKAAVPVYGCGFVCDFPENWRDVCGYKSSSFGRWRQIFDPSSSLEIAKIPILFVNSPVDRWYPLCIWTKSVAIAAHSSVMLDSKLRHGHAAGWAPAEIETYIASKINGGIPPPSVGKIRKNGCEASVKFESAVEIKGAEFFYTLSKGKLWRDFRWESVAAKIDVSQNLLSAQIPEGARAIYFTVTDARNLKGSSNAEILSE